MTKLLWKTTVLFSVSLHGETLLLAITYVKQEKKNSKLYPNKILATQVTLLVLGIKCQQICTMWLSETKAF